MKIIEYFICGKNKNQGLCEDGLYIDEDLIAVIDGVTSKSNRLFNGQSAGKYAKELICEYLSQDVSFLTSEELFYGMNEYLKNHIPKTLLFHELPRASIIVYNNKYNEIWAYGDCQCMINKHLFTHSKLIDEVNSNLRSRYIEHAMLKGSTVESLLENDIGRKKIMNNLMIQFSFENKISCFGYPVLNCQNIENSMIKKYKVHVGDEIILATDGYPNLKETLEESEKELLSIMHEDPLCYKRYKSTKGLQKDNLSFDDRCYCRFII